MIAIAAIALTATVCATEPSSPGSTQLAESAEATLYTFLLLNDAGVRKELRLTPKQLQTVEQLLVETEYPFFLLRDTGIEERNAKLAAIQATLRRGFIQTFEPSQRERLAQLVFQARGAPAIVAPEHLVELRLTESQLARIRRIRENAKQDIERVQKENAADQASNQTSLRNRRHQEEFTKIAELLDDKQRSALNALIGKPYDLSQIKWVATVAPDFRNMETWINSMPLTWKQLRGKVVVVHFWAFGCINCIHNLPCYQRWYDKFSADELVIIGVHTPETESERSVENLRNKVIEKGISYPVAFDAAGDNWRAWANHLWPSVYLVDKQGRVRQWWYGELNWQGAQGEALLSAKIQELLKEQ